MRMFLVVALGLLLALTLQQPALGQVAPSVSYTAISADGRTVYFTWAGDIWSAPRDCSVPATRLTDNVAYDGRPLPSPDGQWLAFLSDRFGNYDIFVMPVGGGPARRLSWDSGPDYLYDWSADSSAILGYCERERDNWGYSLWEFSLAGGEPRRLSGPDYDGHINGSYLGADRLVYARDPGDWARKHYRGTFQHDLWLIDRAAGRHTQLTDYPGKDLWPQPSADGERVYFVSDRDGTENIWELTVDSGALRQLTYFCVDGPRWPRISPDGDELACEVFGEFYIVPVDGGEPEHVAITIASDYKHEMAFDADVANRIGEFALSPNGNYYALTVLGDIYLLKNPDKYEPEQKPDQDLSRTRRLTATPNREMQITWHPKEQKIAYLSDRAGQFDVYVLDLVTLEETRLTDTPYDEWRPKFAPHGDRLAYYSGDRELRIYDFASGQSLLFHYGVVRSFARDSGYEWSPDARWIAFGELIRDDLSDVFIKNVETGEKHNVSKSANWSNGITWSPDGKYVAWGEEAYYYEDPEQTDYVVLLELNPEPESYDFEVLFPADQPAPEPPPEPEPTDATAADADAAGEVTAAAASAQDTAEPAQAESTEEEPDAEEPEPIVIDFEDIEKRSERITMYAGSSWGPMFAPDSKYLLFFSDHTGEPLLYSITIEEREVATLTGAMGKEQFTFSPDGARVLFLAGGNLSYMAMNGPKAGPGGAVPATSHVTYDQWGLWDQLLVEGWRYLYEYFYDENMHGVDWPAVLARYRPRLQRLGSNDEFAQLYREMLGELNASHMGFSPQNGSAAEAPPDSTGYFGVYFEETFGGPGWRVAEVIEDGPADQPGSKLAVGDVITAIDGVSIDPAVERAQLLRNTVGRPLLLTVLRAAEAGAEPAELEVPIKPVSGRELTDLKYEAWVQWNKDEVERLSGGRLNYQHIRSMNHDELIRFRDELITESYDKQGLVLDVRFNSGGSTSVAVMELLARRGAYLRVRRGSGEASYARQQVFENPVVLLINAHSFSNAEILAHVLKDLGLATIVGEATGGNVISTGNVILMDGSRLAMPGFENARLNGENMEGHGAQPDIPVEIDPNVVAQGRDNQLEAAVQFLLGEIEEQQ